MSEIIKTKNGNLTLVPCSARYGKLSHIDHKEKIRDLVGDINMPIGYKLTDSINNNWRS